MQNNTFSTLFIAQNLIQLSTVDSTNDFLKLMLSKSEPLPEGTVIMADKQLAGRGQQGSLWISEAGSNLTFSIYLKPVFLNIEKQFLLNIAISIGINNALAFYVKEGIKIKWPNDIYFDDRKIGGVLIENSIFEGHLKSTVIGIGINVNQRNFDEPNLKQAISLYEILQQDVDLMDLFAVICENVEAEYLKLRAGNYDSQHTKYVYGLYKFGELASYRREGKTFEGKIVDVTDSGTLVVDIDGDQHQFGFKEIEFLTEKGKL